jgi:outer membrane protein OmpA-like peptidoglycan-associated protein
MVQKTIILLLAIVLIAKMPAYATQTDTLRLYYGIDSSKISNQQMKLLDGIANSAEKGSIVVCKGFTDNLGTKSFNQSLSNQRAFEAAKYLRSLGGNYKVTAQGEGQLFSKLSNPKTGDPLNRRVEIIYNKPKSAQQIDTTKGKFGVKLDSLLLIGDGKSLNFNELIFYPGSHHITRQSIPLLNELTKFLAMHKDIYFEIVGHICCEAKNSDGVDYDTKTDSLSVNRAKEVYEYFLSNGISAERMSYRGVGASQPKVYPERNHKDQDANRRVEIVVLKK